MTDDQQWQAPGSAVPPPPSSAPYPAAPVPPAPPLAPPSGPPVGSPVLPPSWPPVAPPAAPGYGAPGWTPPPKPGLIPLRPMTLGTILGGAFQTLRRNPAATLAPALVLTAIVAVIQSLGSAGFLTQYLGAFSDAGDSELSGEMDSGFTSGLLGTLLAAAGSGVLSLIVSAIVQGIVTLQVASSSLGTRLRLGGLWERLRGRRGAVVGWAALVGLASFLSVAIVAAIIIGLAAIGGSAGIVLAILLGLLLGLGLFVALVWLWVKLGFVPAVIVLERASIRTAVQRSWELTRGAFWRTFGIRLLVLAMISIATNIVVTPISLAFSLGSAVLSPNGPTGAAVGSSLVVSVIVTQAVTAVISAVGLVISTATTSLLYLDRRMRREGLDLDLARYVERRQAGEQGLADPYLARASPIVPVPTMPPPPTGSPSGAA